ncbi:hypothetical protein FHS16_003115 [Paenibacillus endophyticus]|uniref:Uncharacterized protein n=1 Tax=Paenibacillus endophyticus TaxID=1294268 RepID=A0A7W5GAR7_9BACL|nr:hypothetical protein [Paenibacillus endophyticus]MBB3153056.1 hypothetical protein [Paenibacillus endophyticus]
MYSVRDKRAVRHRGLLMLLLFGLLTGALSGVILGLVMKLLGQLTGTGVYVLLLNVDFIGWLPSIRSELFEFLLHLSAALPLGILFLVLLSIWSSPLRLGLGMGAAIACCTWIPLTQLSERTPSMLDWSAFMMWVSGHLIYGSVLAALGYVWMTRGWDKE